MPTIKKFPEQYIPNPDPTKRAVYFNHFMKPTDYDTNDWTVTETGAGTQAISNAVNGELLLTNAAGIDDLVSLQLQKETLKFISGKAFKFKIKFKVSDATQSDWLVGVVITDTSPLSNTDGVYFQSDDGDANIDFHVNKNSTSSSSLALATHSDDTYIELAFKYDGTNELDFYVDDVVKGSLPLTNLPDDEELTVTIHHQNGEAVAKNMTIDYILADMDV